MPLEALAFLDGLPGWVRSHTGCTSAGLEGLSLSLERLPCCGAPWLTLPLAAGLQMHTHVSLGASLLALLLAAGLHMHAHVELRSACKPDVHLPAAVPGQHLS